MTKHVNTSDHPVHLEIGLSVGPGEVVANVSDDEQAVVDGHLQPVEDSDTDPDAVVEAQHDAAAFAELVAAEQPADESELEAASEPGLEVEAVADEQLPAMEDFVPPSVDAL